MIHPERFSNLPEYAFPRLRALLDGHAPGGPRTAMSIGEPRHAMPAFVAKVLDAHLSAFGSYPSNEGAPELLAAIDGFLARRYGVAPGADRIMALNGSREGLVSIALALCPEQKQGAQPVVLTPNPFYQAYAVGALAVGAAPHYVPATRATGNLPDYAALPPALLDRVALAYVCSPSNPQGAVAQRGYWAELLALAERHDFRIIADECYAEIWRDAPPTGLLEVAAETGADPERVLVVHSLSKRSNLPGMRAGFVAGGVESIRRLRHLRAYGGAPMAGPLQAVAAAVWADDAHVAQNRALYQQKYRIADEVLSGVPGYVAPPAGFFLWLAVPDGEEAALKLWRETGVTVLPGAYLGRDADTTGHGNPGRGFIRVAMVAEASEFRDGLTRLRDCLYA